jgi:hypothetical protein
LAQAVALVGMLEAEGASGADIPTGIRQAQLAVQTALHILSAVEMAEQAEPMPPMAPLVVRVECLVAAVAEAGHKVEAVQAGKAHVAKLGCGFTNERHNKKESSWR